MKDKKKSVDIKTVKAVNKNVRLVQENFLYT